MKKRVLAILCVCALSCVGTIGLTACDPSVPKGDMVTEEMWKEAIQKTGDVKNYTLEAALYTDCRVDGTVYGRSYGDADSKKHYIKSEASTDWDMTVLYDKDQHLAYREYSSELSVYTRDNLDVYAKDNLGLQTNYIKATNKDYYELKEETEKSTQYWRAGWFERKTVEGDKFGEDETSKKSDWRVNETSSFMYNYINDMFDGTVFYETNDSETAKAVTLVDLYGSFTFSKGVYTANLYRKAELYSDYVTINDFVPVTVTVSFNAAECCVTGCGIEGKGSGTLSENKYDVEYRWEGKSVYSISKIGSTDVSKKVNKDIKKALQLAK